MSPQRSALLTTAIFVAIAVPVSWIRPLWLDEILQLIETRQPSTIHMISDLRKTPGAVPLGYLVQQAALKITGYSILRARLPSALFAAGAIFLLALLGTQLGLQRGWHAAVIFALLPLTLRYAVESRVYSQALFLSVLATYSYLRMAEKPSRAIAAQYWLALTAAVCTQPYSLCVGLGHLLCSVICRARRTALLCGCGLALALLAFLPWLLWVRPAWTTSAARNAFHFSASVKTPLMLFRELAGTGYWGSGLILLLCVGALTGDCPNRMLKKAKVRLFRRQVQNSGYLVTRAYRTATVREPVPNGLLQQPARTCYRVLPVVLIATVLFSVLSADAGLDYFIAARQFMWLLPAVAVLAAGAVERHPRAGLALAMLLAIVCIRQSVTFFRSTSENWEMAANVLADQVRQGRCLIVAPPEQAPLYEFFRPELESTSCVAPGIVLAITPAATSAQRSSAIETLILAGYKEAGEVVVGRSDVVWFHRP